MISFDKFGTSKIKQKKFVLESNKVFLFQIFVIAK